MIIKRFQVPFLKQWFAAGNVFLLTTSVGLTFGWISPFLGNLVRPDPHFEVTKEQTSWIASLTSLSQPIGIIFAYLMVNFWGSKVCAHVCGIFFITAWVILIFATTVQHVFASLTLLGIGIGIVYMIFPIYMAEISDYKIRGALVGFVVHGITIGTVMGNLLGAVLNPSTYGIINFVIILICVISFAFVPSTPHYLIRQKKMKEAEKSIIWYNNDVNSAAEVKKISEFLETSPSLPFLKSLREEIQEMLHKDKTSTSQKRQKDVEKNTN
ncbi:sugar transporter domain-containing protein [Phthorimaea operculella]|nr:sugar transporter domain-containing protein [Phthorimaea operculella]